MRKKMNETMTLVSKLVGKIELGQGQLLQEEGEQPLDVEFVIQGASPVNLRTFV